MDKNPPVKWILPHGFTVIRYADGKKPFWWQVLMLSQGAPSWAPSTLPSPAGVSSIAQGLAHLLQKGAHCTLTKCTWHPIMFPRMINKLSGTTLPGLLVPSFFLSGGTMHLTGAPWTL